ncbi:MAG: hypothetical protein C4539_13170 [Ignavibacteriales bacterium]|nr:MAG: hypothetical protein C4539_13170 [Ignavibacteriales bacterium]
MQITNRLDFGKLFTRLGYAGNGAEIGVQRGDFSSVIRNSWKNGTIHLIDRWRQDDDYLDVANISYREQLNNYLYVVTRFSENYDVKIYRMDSVEATDHFPDEYFDWIYIDADHSYEGCKRDLKAWYPKLKKGGMFCGHDFLDGTIPAGVFGVKTAVEEFMKETDAQLFVTQEREWKSWYFIKDNVLDLSAIRLEDDSDQVEETNTKKFLYAESLIEQGDLIGARAQLNDILIDNPADVNVLNDLAVIEILENNFENAEQTILKVLAIDKTNEVALENLNYLIKVSKE